MAPSLRKPTPTSNVSVSTSARNTPKSRLGSKTQQQQQDQGQLKSALNNAGFGRVTKSRSSRLGLRVKFSDIEKGAFEKWQTENEQVQEAEVQEVVVEVPRQQPQVPRSNNSESEPRLGAKRKLEEIDEDESGSEDGSAAESRRTQGRQIHQGRKVQKKLSLSDDGRSTQQRLQRQYLPLSPPASRDGTDCDEDSTPKSRSLSSPRCPVDATPQPISSLPQFLLDSISMHSIFLKALSLHYAHNGTASPVELNTLMESMTRFWKKQTIRKDAVQRMLGLYEVSNDPASLELKQVEQRNCPFKLVTSGLGSNVRTNLEYIGDALFSDNALQATYTDLVHRISRANPLLQEGTNLPLLTVVLGTQTSLHRSKAASTRAEILSLSASAQARSTPDFSKLSLADPFESTPATVKSRTLSLFDRVRAKGLASANNAAPTSEQIARRHAMGRMSEVVEFLRMKQQQKLSSRFQSSIHDSPGKSNNGAKVSFSLGAIVRDIRQSVAIPIAEEDVKMCLRILSRELPGDWCRIIELGQVVSVTLQGVGISGIEAKRMIEAGGSRS